VSFSFRPAIRQNATLMIGLAGGTGSGKTYSAMELATGLSGGQRFAVIDTEAGRGLHYADMFDFDHGELGPPFRPDAYLEAIVAADQAHYPVIVVDSFSHEHAGEGGLLDWQDEEFKRLGGKEQVKMTAWIAPKKAHRRMVNRLLQIRAHLILCLRAEEKVEIVKDEQGKTVVRPKQSLAGLDGWVPICEKTLPYEMTVSFLLHQDRPGVPRPIKLPERLREIFPSTRQLDREEGQQLAVWAQGSAGGPSATTDGDAAPPAVASSAPAASPAPVAPESAAGSPADDDLTTLRELLIELGIDLEPLDLGSRKPEWIRSQIRRAQGELDARDLARGVT
jgi:hypothetical protein